MCGKRNGFTLVELLVVIAIIAVLAAILFPVFGRVRESARQTTCMANMHSVWLAAQLYKQDYNAYPCLLLGAAERPDGYAWTPGYPQPPVPASRITHGFLYPNYVKSIDVFHCPDNPGNDMQKTTTACYAPGSPWVQYLQNLYGVDEPPVSLGCIKNLDPKTDYSKDVVQFYLYDSYDISSSVQKDGSRGAPLANNLGCYLVYSKKWTPFGPSPKDPPNQLQYPNAPNDQTVLTWCNYHVTTAHSDKSPMILNSGTVKPRDYQLMLLRGWSVASTN